MNGTRAWLAAPAAVLALGFSLAAGCGRGASSGDGSSSSAGASAALDGMDALADSDAPPPVVVPADAPAVLFLSDSIGAGLHLAEHQAFPAVLQRRLVAAGHPFRLVNASESGRTTAGGVGALDWTLRSEPDLVVIALGGNDGLRGVPVAEVERNLRTMIARVRAAGARVLLLGIRLPANYGDYGAAFDALYPALAAELRVDFLPFYMEGVGGVPELNLADGLHPTPAGHERLADNVAPALLAALE
jgi:acyl-CoA thioesterase-1